MISPARDTASARPDASSVSNQTPAPAAPTTGPEANSEYILGAEDAISVTVWKEPTLSGVHVVRPDGKISMPLLDDLTAAGLTPMQLSTEITTQLKKFVKDPLVTVSVQTINSQRIYLIGQIAHTGPITLTPGMTPLQAIAAAGGPSTFANEKKIYVLRQVSGKQQKIPFNYKLALKTGNLQGVVLASGDTIVIP